MESELDLCTSLEWKLGNNESLRTVVAGCLQGCPVG